MQYTGHVIQTKKRDCTPDYLRFQLGCEFAEYDLFKPTISIQNCIYMNFRINLIQFDINFSRQEHQIELS